MLYGTIRGQVLNDFSVYVKENLHFIFGQVRILIFVVKFDGRIEKRLPYFFGMVLLAHFDSII